MKSNTQEYYGVPAVKEPIDVDRHLLSLHSLSDIKRLMDFALQSLLKILQAESGSFFIWDEYQKGFVLKTALGRYRDRVMQNHATIPIRLSEGILGWAGQRGQSILVKDIQQDDRLAAFKTSGRYRSPSFIVLPLISCNRLMGMINITEKQSLDPFTDEDYERAQLFAKHITLAYEKLHTIELLKKDQDSLQKMYRKVSEELKANESLITIGKFSMHMAHELTNPLDAIRRYVNMALDQVDENSVAREYLLNAKKGIRFAIEILKGLVLLHVTKESFAHEGKRIELNKFIVNSLSALRENPLASGVVIQTELSNKTIHLRESGLSIVLNNLYTNAVQAMNGKGTLNVSTDIESDFAVIRVSDTGPGIPDAIQSKVFEPFFTTKKNHGGCGIGLALAKEILARKKGSIEFTSIPNKGTSFLIKIPCESRETTE